jgi:hypothetical protein
MINSKRQARLSVGGSFLKCRREISTVFRLDDVRLHLLYHRSGVNSQSYERVDVDSRGRFVIEKLFTGDYELMIGPMSVEVTGDAGGKTMSRMPTVKQTVSARSGAESDISKPSADWFDVLKEAALLSPSSFFPSPHFSWSSRSSSHKMSLRLCLRPYILGGANL